MSHVSGLRQVTGRASTQVKLDVQDMSEARRMCGMYCNKYFFPNFAQPNLPDQPVDRRRHGTVNTSHVLCCLFRTSST